MNFRKITTGNQDLDRVQQEIVALAASIKDPAGPVIVTARSDYSITGSEDVIHADAQRGPIRITLKAPGANLKPLTVKQVNPTSNGSTVNEVTIASADGSKTIAGVAFISLGTSGTGSVVLTCDGRQFWPAGSQGSSGASASGAGIVYVPGDGIKISGNVISATATGAGNKNILGEFPITVTGGPGPSPIVQSGRGLNAALQYVSPDGDDSHDGLTWITAKRTGYAAYKAIVAANTGTIGFINGGRLYAHVGTEWGGPVPGQGCWLRGDGAGYGPLGEIGGGIPGWLPTVPSIITIVGAAETQNQFAAPGLGFLRGGSNHLADFRRMPSVWIAGHNDQQVSFEYVVPISAIGYEEPTGSSSAVKSNMPWRIGWDYARNVADGSIQYLQVTSSQRSAGLSTHTVTLPNPGVAITTASRPGGSDVFFTIPRPTGLATFPPWNNGTWVWFESTDPGNFPSGAYQVANCSSNLDDQSNWSFTVTSAGATAVTSSPGHIRSIMTSANLFVDLESSSDQFPSTQYRVASTAIVNGTTGTIVVTDPFGGHNGVNATQGPTANIGQIAHQERGYAQTIGLTFNYCGGNPLATEEIARYQAGPTWDIGSINAIPITFNQCLFQAYIPPPGSTNVYDNNRMSGIFCAPGNIGGAGFFQYRCGGTQAGIRYIVGPSQGRMNIDMFVDTNNGFPPPIYDIESNYDLTVNIVQAATADAIGAYGTPVVNGTLDPLKWTGVSCPVNTVGPAMGPVGTREAWLGGVIPKTPWASKQIATFGSDLKTSGRHASSWRQMGAYGARFHNLIGPTSGWIIEAGTITSNQLSWDGTNNAFLTSPGFAAIMFLSPDPINSFEAGGRYVVAGWVNFSDPAHLSGSALFGWNNTGTPGAITWASSGTGAWTYDIPTKYTGWQFCIAYDVVASVTGPSQTYEINLNGAPAGASTGAVFDGFVGYYVPASIDDNDFYEFLGTLRHQPWWLRSGISGTTTNQPFIGHGGIGVDSSVPVTPSGSDTPTKNLPLLQSDGTVQGYIPIIPTNSNLAGSPGDHKVAATNADATPDFLINKIGSTTGNIVVNTFAGGPSGLEVNLNALLPSSVSYFMNITLTVLSTGWIAPNDNANFYASAVEMPAPFIVQHVTLTGNLITNGIPIGPGITIVVTRNGSNIIGAVNNFNNASPTGWQSSGPIATGSASAADTYGITWGSGPASGNITVSFTLTLDSA